MIAGFEDPTAGVIRIADRVANDLPVEKRGVGLVFQSYALFPHLSVANNIAFGLRLRRVPSGERDRRVTEMLKLVGLEDLGERLPRQISGGQQQRVALARALAVSPSVLLFDEPLSNLDLKLREQMRDEIRRVQRKLGITAVYVTHDQGEAMSMSDRIAVMNKGRIEQIGSPTTIYENPASLFVAGFIGQCNVIPGTYRGMAHGQYQFVSANGTSFAVAVDPMRKQLELGQALNLVLRPEAIEIGSSASDLPNQFSVKVEDAVYLGEKTGLLLQVKNGPEKLLAAFRGSRGCPLPKPGEILTAQVDPSECVFVDG